MCLSLSNGRAFQDATYFVAEALATARSFMDVPRKGTQKKAHWLDFNKRLVANERRLIPTNGGLVQMIFLFKCRCFLDFFSFHVKFPGCASTKTQHEEMDDEIVLRQGLCLPDLASIS